jgi:hypothetical protein
MVPPAMSDKLVLLTGAAWTPQNLEGPRTLPQPSPVRPFTCDRAKQHPATSTRQQTFPDIYFVFNYTRELPTN